MPPRFAYWTILVGGLPTAFRAAEREEIEPTFKQLRQKHPDAEMRWFARGKLWASPAEASEAWARQKAQGTRQKKDFGERRDRNWRPGGSHRDPRQPYIDAKKRENQRRKERRFEFKQRPESRHKAQGTGHKEERPDRKWGRPPYKARPETEDRRPKTGNDRPTWNREFKPKWSDRPKWGPPKTRDARPKIQDQRPDGDRPRPKWKNRPGGDRPPKPKWRDRDREEWHKAQGTGHKDEQKPWERSGPKWRPPRQEGPKTEDRRPKTSSGPGAGRGRWGAPSGGPRNGPGRGRRK